MGGLGTGRLAAKTSQKRSGRYGKSGNGPLGGKDFPKEVWEVWEVWERAAWRHFPKKAWEGGLWAT